MTDEQYIRDTINLYFTGTFYGDANQLKQAFHPDARISGLIKEKYYDWTLTDFIQKVITTPSAAIKNEVFNKKILFLDKSNHAAIAKTRVIVGDLVFIDYISLLNIDNQWVIRNKSFTTE